MLELLSQDDPIKFLLFWRRTLNQICLNDLMQQTSVKTRTQPEQTPDFVKLISSRGKLNPIFIMIRRS